MRRLLMLVVLLFVALPFGISIAGCSKKTLTTFCDGNDSGPAVGQLTTLIIQPRLTGISLNQGQIGSVSSPAGTDCKGTTVTATNLNYGSSDLTLVDIQPTSGRLCAGIWNRNSGGGVPDFTVCNPNGKTGIGYVTVSSSGVVSNPLPVFVHPVVTSIVLGAPSVNCTTDPASNCIDLNQPTACTVGVPAAVVNPYTGDSCLSQGAAGQLVARTFAGATNISCQTGPLTFSAQSAGVVTIDQNGVATATQPGATLINAAISNASSSIGAFATCPPKSIVLSPAGTTVAPTSPITVAQNVQQTFVTTVTDTNGNPITNISLEFVSTVPQTVPVAGGIVTPTFPGAASITAICQPPACNTAPVNQIGLYGNGLTVTSNPVQINATGSNLSTVLYVASTGSQFIQPYDFTVTTQGSAIRLPYAPNSMVLSTDLNTLYMGTTNELMVFSTNTNSLTAEYPALTGTAISVSPNSGTLVFTDPVRQLTYLVSSSGAVTTKYGGVATHAQWAPDSQTVYITTTDGRMLVYSTFNGWTSVPLANVASDLAVTVPSTGVYLANGASTVTGRTTCPTVFVNPKGSGGIYTTINTPYPQADVTTAVADRVASTNDGVHILGASATNGVTDIRVSAKTGACPVTFTSTPSTTRTFSTAVPATITAITPTTDSAYALVTYTGSGAVVPQYVPSTGVLSNIPLQTVAGRAAPAAPVAGTFSSDNNTFYVGTTGDNLVHQLTRGASSFSEISAPLVPGLPGITGGIATPNLLAQKPRKTGS